MIFYKHCSNHFFRKAKGMCHLCEKIFCERCLNSFDDVPFCTTHLSLIEKTTWTLFDSFESDSDTPEKGHEIYKLKNFLWIKFKIQSYLKTEYEVNDSSDKITSKVFFYVPKESFSQILDIKKAGLNIEN